MLHTLRDSHFDPFATPAGKDTSEEGKTDAEVSVHAGELTPAALKELGVQCVVCTETPRARLVELNEFCRSQSPPVAFLSAETFGLAGAVFSDFGPESPAQTLGMRHMILAAVGHARQSTCDI